MKILICQLRNHGDIIRTFPLIEALKTKYPGCFIGFTCIKEMEETCRLCKDIDEIIIQPRLMPIEDHVDYTRICNCEPLEESVCEVRKKGYDIYIDLHGVFQSSIFGCLAQIPIRVGRSQHTAKDGAHLFYNYVANIEKKETNRMERHFLIAQKYFKNLVPEYKETYKCFEKNKVAVIPGSSVKGRLKRWGAKNYIELIEKISIENKVIVLLGPEERELYSKFSELKYPNIEVEIINKWEEYCEVYKNCRYIIGNDSAALHIAIWKRIPTFMICGPTSAAINSVWKYGVGKGIMRKEKCSCKDVWSGRCTNYHECMKGLTADMVMKEIEHELNRIEGR